VVWSIFAMFLMKRDLVWIIEGFREISKLERNIDKWLSWEIKVAKILNEIANKDEKICVFHDIFMWFENIDHLVIYDNRILIVIETKSSSKFPYGLRLINLISQIRRQWNFLHNQTWLYIHPLWVFTEAHVEPFKRVKEIELINISYLERKIKRIIAEDTRSHLNHDAIIKIQEIQKKYINKELSYLTLLVW
jgi:hypothetical protein